MDKEQFLRELDSYLVSIPESDRLDAVAYYRDYLDEAGEANEARVIRELGNPRKVAQSIMDDYKASAGTGSAYTHREYSAPERETYEDRDEETYTKKEETWEDRHTGTQADGTYSNKTRTNEQNTIRILAIIIVVLTFPVWIGLVAGVFGGGVGIIGGLFGSGLGLSFGGIALSIAAFFAGSELELFTMLGIGLLLLSIGLWIALLLIWLVGVWIPKLMRFAIKVARGIFDNKRDGGDTI